MGGEGQRPRGIDHDELYEIRRLSLPPKVGPSCEVGRRGQQYRRARHGGFNCSGATGLAGFYFLSYISLLFLCCGVVGAGGEAPVA